MSRLAAAASQPHCCRCNECHAFSSHTKPVMLSKVGLTATAHLLVRNSPLLVGDCASHVAGHAARPDEWQGRTPQEDQIFVTTHHIYPGQSPDFCQQGHGPARVRSESNRSPTQSAITPHVPVHFDQHPPLPLRRVFKQVLLPRVNLPLFITSVSRALMFSWLFFCRHISGVYSSKCPTGCY